MSTRGNTATSRILMSEASSRIDNMVIQSYIKHCYSVVLLLPYVSYQGTKPFRLILNKRKFVKSYTEVEDEGNIFCNEYNISSSAF